MTVFPSLTEINLNLLVLCSSYNLKKNRSSFPFSDNLSVVKEMYRKFGGEETVEYRVRGDVGVGGDEWSTWCETGRSEE